MIARTTSPQHLMVILTLYFAVFIASIMAIGISRPDWLSMLPLGGVDALEVAGIEASPEVLDDFSKKSDAHAAGFEPVRPTSRQIGLVALFLSFSLAGTVLVMLPISWTYMISRREIGYRKNFLRALIILPICATAIVLLIQDSLALAFGLAAMVAAVRFRVDLDEAIDGIYIFAAICVGLAAGVGHLGIAILMAIFFCFTHTFLCIVNYGRNELDDARDAKIKAKLSQ